MGYRDKQPILEAGLGDYHMIKKQYSLLTDVVLSSPPRIMPQGEWNTANIADKSAPH